MYWRFVWIHVIVASILGACIRTSVRPVFARDVLPRPTNDTFLEKQWYLDAIHAREGWNVATGSRDVVVAVIDGGIDIDHQDLKEQIWTNPAEIPDNGKDDDGDGYIDDAHGWNFVENTSEVRPRVSAQGLEEAFIHGTAVASLIAGIGNNDIGIAGVAWRARIMPLVALDIDGYGRDDNVIKAIRFAVTHGADIINLSLVGYEFDSKLADAIREATAQGVLVVSAAGNSEVSGGINLDRVPGYPACDKGIGNLGQLTVTAIDRAHRKSDRANYGSCIDVSAPGSDLFAARPDRDAHHASRAAPGYVGNLYGTSIAAPLVSGLAALLKAAHPSWRGPEIAMRILTTADSVDDKNPAYRGALGRGRINAWRALTEDAVTEALGPLLLEGSAPGRPPEVRVLTLSGKELRRFAVGESGDRRGVRATFIRWQKNLEPDIAVSMIGDAAGAWRIYRPDGLLIAAGALGADIGGGVFLSASDVNASGEELLFLGEANGRRAWILSSTTPAQDVTPFADATIRGIVALSVTRPEPSFFITVLHGASQFTIIGRDGTRISNQLLSSKKLADNRNIRRKTRQGESDLFSLSAGATSTAFVASPNGLDHIDDPFKPGHIAESPQGELRSPEWLLYGLWPR